MVKHFVQICGCGVVVSQCRCIGTKREVVAIVRPCSERPDSREPS